MNILLKKNKGRDDMKVILKEDIKGVGKKNEIINASDGYARNFLLPKNKAVEANAENMSKLQAQKDANLYKKSVEKEEAKKIANNMEKIVIKIQVKAGKNGKILGISKRNCRKFRKPTKNKSRQKENRIKRAN
jgi:ribosomal protein L9